MSDLKASCAYCSGLCAFQQMTVDHIIPKSSGGKNHQENLLICCRSCNIKKGKKKLSKFKPHEFVLILRSIKANIRIGKELYSNGKLDREKLKLPKRVQIVLRPKNSKHTSRIISGRLNLLSKIYNVELTDLYNKLC